MLFLFIEALVWGFACTFGVLIALGFCEAWKYVTRKTGGKK